MRESTGKAIMALATAGCLLMMGAAAYVAFILPAGPPVPPVYSAPGRPAPDAPAFRSPCPLSVIQVRPGDAEQYGFKHGDAEVPAAYAAELRRRCNGWRERGGGAR